MTRCQSRWVNVIIITIVVILRFPCPAIIAADEGYGIIANDTLMAGMVYRTAVDTPKRQHLLFTSPFQGGWKNNLLPFTSSPSLPSQPPPWSCGELARENGDGGRGMVVLAMPCLSMLPAGGHSAANTESRLFLALSVPIFLQGERRGWGWMFLSGADRRGDVRQPAVTLGQCWRISFTSGSFPCPITDVFWQQAPVW